MNGARILRLLLRGMLALGLLAVALLAGLYAFTFTDTFRELAREQALTLLRGVFRGDQTSAASSPRRIANSGRTARQDDRG
jgi:hypothetical protein